MRQLINKVDYTIVKHKAIVNNGNIVEDNIISVETVKGSIYSIKSDNILLKLINWLKI